MKSERHEIRDYDGGHTALIETRDLTWADAIQVLIPRQQLDTR